MTPSLDIENLNNESISNTNIMNSSIMNSSIYKIQFLTNKDAENISISNILVFRGNNDNNTDKMLYFTEEEKQNIRKINLSEDNIHLIDEYIYPDDTLKTIKFKIIINYPVKDLCYDELYMFSRVSTTINNANLYDRLSQNDKNNITLNKLEEYLYNIQNKVDIEHLKKNKDGSDIEDKSNKIITYDDLLSLKLDQQQLTSFIPLGHRFVNEYNYIYNVLPFTSYATTLSKSILD